MALGNLAALSPDQLSVILQYLADPLLIVGEDRCILAMNATAEALIGRPADEVVGRRTCQETIACQDRQGRSLCDACPHQAAAATRVALSRTGLTVRDGHGRALPVTATFFPLQGEPGAPRSNGLILHQLAARAASRDADPTARTDGLYSRERFQAVYERERERAQRFQSGLAVVRVSVRSRTAAGGASAKGRPATRAQLDAAFARVTRLLVRSLRLVDVVGHCGDHDCALLLPAASFASTRAVVVRLEALLRDLAATGALPDAVEVSVGTILSEGYDDLLARSYQRLAPLPPHE